LQKNKQWGALKMVACYRQNIYPIRQPASKAEQKDATFRTNEDHLLHIVTQAAETRDICPSNAYLANLFGYVSTGSVHAVFRKLVDRGLIKVDSYGVKARTRVVTILATGKHTKPPAFGIAAKAWATENGQAPFASDDVTARAVKMRLDGHTFPEIAEAFGFSKNSAQRIVRSRLSTEDELATKKAKRSAAE